jgi:hypothetical protein
LLVIVAWSDTASSQAQTPGAAFSAQERSRVVERLKSGFRNAKPAGCQSRCRRPVSVHDKIFCCVTCLGAEYVCSGPAGGCFCEVPF